MNSDTHSNQKDTGFSETGGHRKVGILGGTFDPIHYGHIYLAEQARDSFDLDIVYFMPTDDPYYKADSKVSAFEDRLNMVRLALYDRERLLASDFEKIHDTDGYTVNSLSIYKSLYPEDELFFIIGGDSLFSMEKWKDIDKIFQMTTILVNKRKGENKGASGSLAISSDESAEKGIYDEPDTPAELDQELNTQITYLKERFGAVIYNLNAPQFDISSSELRKKICDGENVNEYIPPLTAAYIREHHLYLKQ